MRAIASVLLVITSFLPQMSPAQYVPSGYAFPSSGGAKTVVGFCSVNNYQPAGGGPSSCTTSLTVAVNDALVAFAFTDATSLPTPASASCVSSWSTTTSTAVHFMAASIGVVTSSGSCTPSMTAGSVSNNNGFMVFQIRNASGVFDVTPLMKSGGFGTPTTTSSISPVTNGDVIVFADINTNTSTYTTISFSDGTTINTSLNAQMPGTNVVEGLAIWGTQATAATTHGIYTNSSVNGDPVYIAAVK